MKHSLTKFFIKVLAVLLITVISGCASLEQPKHPQNLKLIFDEKRSWYYSARKSSKKWNIPISTMMSIMYQESSYRSDAEPPRPWFFFIPLPRSSSAYGYPQAQDGTWDMYKNEAGSFFSSRSNFADSIDFMGWYLRRSIKLNNIPTNRADLLYFSYHDGWHGFKRGTYKKKPWLLKVAKKVQRRADRYKSQLQ